MADRSTDEIRAELRAAELTEQLQAAKATPGGPSLELKDELREARRVFREYREARPAGPGQARPDTIETTAGTADLGG